MGVGEGCRICGVPRIQTLETGDSLRTIARGTGSWMPGAEEGKQETQEVRFGEPSSGGREEASR